MLRHAGHANYVQDVLYVASAWMRRSDPVSMTRYPDQLNVFVIYWIPAFAGMTT